MPTESPKHDSRVLLLAPTQRDAEAIGTLLERVQIECVPTATITALCGEIASGAGAVIVSEESLAAEGPLLAASLATQPVWSDLPVIVLSRSGVESTTLEQLFGRLGNMTVLERPVRLSTFQSVIVSALRARDQQYEVRDHLRALVKVESALRGSQQQLEMVVKGANVGVWQCPLPLDQLVWDETTKRHFFLPSDATVTIETFFARLHPDDRERTQAAIDESIASRQPFAIEYRTVGAASDDLKWIRALGRATYDDLGAAVAFSGITLDITSQKLAEHELRASEERLRLAVQTGRLGVWDLDPRTNTMECSAACKANFGRGPDDRFTYQDLWNAIHPEDRERVQDAANKSIAERCEYDIEYRNFWPDGSMHWVLARAYPTYDNDGHPHRLIGVTLDITDRKASEESRTKLLEAERAARGEAERTSQIKDEFLATLSHELRTPLNAILGWAQILRMSSSANLADITQGVEIIERNARAQAQIIDDLLDMSRIISGKVRLDVQPIDLTAVVAAAIGTVQPAANAKQIQIHTAMDTRAVQLTGDPNRLQQVFWNLLSNAVKFTPERGQVNVSLRRVNSHVEVSVHDNGEGIEPAFLPFVFDRFRQANATTTRPHGGLGLGLAIVRQLVELHGGAIRVHSDGHGQGATFTVVLPLSPTYVDPPPAANRRAPSAALESRIATPNHLSMAGVRVLVVDDEPDSRLLLRRLLEDCQASVLAAQSSHEAMNVLKAERPHVLISDIGMPHEDGYALIRKVRALSPEHGGNTPAVALTAYARAEDRVTAIRAGFQHHLAKPVEPAELIAILVSLLGRS